MSDIWYYPVDSTVKQEFNLGVVSYIRTLQLGGLGQGCRKLPHFAIYHYFAVLYCSAYFILLGNIFFPKFNFMVASQLATYRFSFLKVT